MIDFRAPYSGYDVLDKWDSPSWNEQTRSAIGQRLDRMPERRFLTENEWSLLQAIVDRLLPQPDREEPVPIVPWIDALLHHNHTPGFRYADMPPMRDAWRQGLKAIAAEARERFCREFLQISPCDQDELLRDVELNRVDSRFWGNLPAGGFFKHHLLKEVVGIYYSHPAAWSEIGYGGPASPRGYARLGFDERDPWEAEEVEPSDA